MNAQWIWTDTEEINQYIEIRQTFISHAGDAAVIDLSADSEYVLWINGVFAGYDQYDDFPMHKSYNTHAIGALLREGENELLIRAWHQGTDSFQYIPGPAGVIFEVRVGENVIAASGSETLVRPCTAYECGPIEKISSQLSYTFHYDETCPAAEWTKARIVDERQATRLYPRPVEQLVTGAAIEERVIASGVYRLNGGETPAQRMQYAFLAPGSDCADADGQWIIADLGRQEAGLFYIEAECEEGSEITVGYGEHLDDMRVRTWVGNRNFAFTCRFGKGVHTYTHYFRRIAGRYLEAFMPFGCKIKRLTLLPVTYPVREGGLFQSGNEKMDRIWQTAKRTLLLCMHEHYEDSPWREQGLYAMDSRNQALCGYIAFGEAKFARECLRLMAKSCGEDGLMEICAPAIAAITIPTFSLGWIIALRDYVLYTGDRGFAREMWPAVEKRLSFFFARMTADGLTATPQEKRYWNFYEWADGLDGHGERKADRYDAPHNFMLGYALRSASQIAGWIGESDAAGELDRRRAHLMEACDAAFWDGKENLYRTYTGEQHFCELTQALALLSGACGPERAFALRETLAAPDERLVKTTLSYALFKYEALIEDKRFRQAAMEDCLRQWGHMIDKGATSFWETIEGADAFSKAGSLCHGWSAVPLWLWTEAYIGLQPTEPGFAAFDFDPMPEWTGKAVVPTPLGDIVIEGKTCSRT